MEAQQSGLTPEKNSAANKFLLEGFFAVERTWRNICAVRNVSDFKTVTSYRLIGEDQYEQVPTGGEIKHGTLGNESRKRFLARAMGNARPSGGKRRTN